MVRQVIFFFSPFFRKDLIFLPWFKKTNSKRISKGTWVTHSFIISIFAFYFHFRWFQTGMSWPILMIFLDSVKRNMLHELYIKKNGTYEWRKNFLKWCLDKRFLNVLKASCVFSNTIAIPELRLTLR